MQTPGQVQRGSREGSEGSAGEGSGRLWCRRWVRFNRVPEKAPKVPEKVLGGFGAEPGQVQQGSGEGSGRLWCRCRVRFGEVCFSAFSPTAYATGVFSPDMLRCAPVQAPGQVQRSSGRFRSIAGPCSPGFRKVPEHTGAGAGFQSGLRFRRWRCSGQVQVKSGSRRFWRAQEVPARFGGEGSEG